MNLVWEDESRTILNENGPKVKKILFGLSGNYDIKFIEDAGRSPVMTTRLSKSGAQAPLLFFDKQAESKRSFLVQPEF